jgi:hypothetical protein
MKPCIDELRTAGYIDCGAVVGGGVNEQDTGYAAFFRQYPSFSNMEEHLCDDFSTAESDLDGSWFDTLNFESMTVSLKNDTRKGRLIYSGGKITLQFDNVEDELERQIQSVLEPFQYRDQHKGGDSPSADKATNPTCADSRGNNHSKKEYSNLKLANSGRESLVEKEAMMNQLRADIIEHLKREASVVPYVLENTYVNDLDNCFDPRYQWDGMRFKLDLKGKKIYVEVETYPNQFGASFTDKLNLKPDQFGEIAQKYHFRKELQFLKTQNDLDQLFNHELTNAISEVLKKEEIARNKTAELYAVNIPKQFNSRRPRMNINLLELNLCQRYGATTVSLQRNNNSYHLKEIITYRTNDEPKYSERNLNQVESVMVEKLVNNTLNNPDNSEWHSYAGFDTMNIKIQTASNNLLLEHIEPLKKYYDLMHDLSNLSKYGSNNRVVSSTLAKTTVDTKKESNTSVMERKEAAQQKGTDRKGTLACLILLTVMVVVLLLNIIINTEANTSTPAIIAFVLSCMFIAGMWVWYIIGRVRQKRLNNKNENKHADNNVDNTAVAPAASATTYFDAGTGVLAKESSSAETEQVATAEGNKDVNIEATRVRNNTFVCSRCKKELPIKYLYKANMCTSCYETAKQEREAEKKRMASNSVRPVKSTLRDTNRQSLPRYYDPYSYEREHVWKYQVELMYIPDFLPVRKLGSNSSREDYDSGHEIIYIDDRNGNLIRASYSAPAFNTTAGSRDDYPITYEKLHELAVKYMNEPRVKYNVTDRSALLELNKDNWMEWMLTHLEKYRSMKAKPEKTVMKSGCEIVKVADLESYLKSHGLLKNAYLCIGYIGRGPDRVSVVNGAQGYDIYISSEKGSVDYLRLHEGTSVKEARSLTEEEACKSIIDLFSRRADAEQRRRTVTRLAEAAVDSHVDGNGYLHYKLSDHSLSSDEKPRLTHLTISAFRPNRTSIVCVIPHGSFKDCTKLVYVQIQEGVYEIEAESFENCISLQTVVLPASLKKIDGVGEYEEGIDDGHGRGIWTQMRAAAFNNCPSLQKVYYTGTKEQWSKIDIGPGNECLQNADVEYNYRKGIGFGDIYKADRSNEFLDYLPLYTWEERVDDYSSQGECYSYLRSDHQLFSRPFYDVAAGCGHGGSGKNTITTWENLLADAKAHSGSWNEETWKKVCEDFEQHPELNCPAFDELNILRNKSAD